MVEVGRLRDDIERQICVSEDAIMAVSRGDVCTLAAVALALGRMVVEVGVGFGSGRVVALDCDADVERSGRLDATSVWASRELGSRDGILY